MLKEFKVEGHIRDYIQEKGWKTTNLPKGIGEHGVDITARHPTWRKIFLIEVKGVSGSITSKHAIKHNAFNNILGQILSRIKSSK